MKEFTGDRGLNMPVSGILVTLGLTWLFGAVAIGDAKLVFQYLFTIFNSMQGLLVFIFYCVLSVQTRTKYKTHFGIDQGKDSNTGCTGTYNSALEHTTNIELKKFKARLDKRLKERLEAAGWIQWASYGMISKREVYSWIVYVFDLNRNRDPWHGNTNAHM